MNRDSTIPVCCDKCWHSSDRPCSKFVECLNSGPLCHEDPACKASRQTWLERQQRRGLATPVIYLGAGTCGLGAGAAKTKVAIVDYLGRKEILAPVVEVGCIGLCTAEPIVDIQVPGKYRLSFCNVTAEKAPVILESVLAGNVPQASVLGQIPVEGAKAWDDVPLLSEHPFFKPQTRWVLANCGIVDPVSIGDYIGRGGYKAMSKALARMTPPECCDVVEKSGLRGRGGAGFPTGKKWKIAQTQVSDQKYFVCNADEGDPGAFMDRAVIEGDAHRLIEGLVIAAYAIGANKAIVYLRAEYPLAIRRLRQAIVEAKAWGLLGYNILDSGVNIDITIKQGAGAFVCGEETALMHSIEGKRGMPRLRPPFPAVSGLFGKPTVINNVETLANIPGIVYNGAEWFSAVGTAGSKGTKVFALSGKIERTGLVEIAMGRTISEVVHTISGGVPGGKALKAVQIGGPSGGCIPANKLDIQIDYESLKGVGAMMGSGGLVVMDETTCMVDIAKYFMNFIQRESCGKCIPCREGTRRMLEILNRITKGRNGTKGVEAIERFKGVVALEELAQVINDTSLCGLGQSAPNPVLSTLRWFRDEYEAHVYDRKCPAGACIEMMEYRIVEDKCKGCTACIRKCPSQAIKGAPKAPHYIIEDKCVSCGACMDACKFDAIVRG